MWFIPAFFALAAALPTLESPAVERAQTLSLRKDRRAACAVLRRALATAPTGQRARLREALGTAARVFYTDKGQRAFETARASWAESPDGAIAQLKEAMTLENGNLDVRVGLARAYLVKGEFENARTELAAALELDPFDAEVAALELRALIGQKNFPLFRERAKAVPALDHWQEAFVLYLQALDWTAQGATTRASDALAKVTTEFPEFPDAHLELARVSAGARSDRELKKYVSLCRGLSARGRRRFALEPRLCAGVKEVEDELAKKSVDL